MKASANPQKPSLIIYGGQYLPNTYFNTSSSKV